MRAVTNISLQQKGGEEGCYLGNDIAAGDKGHKSTAKKVFAEIKLPPDLPRAGSRR